MPLFRRVLSKKKTNTLQAFGPEPFCTMSPLVTAITGGVLSSYQKMFEKHCRGRVLFAAVASPCLLNKWRRNWSKGGRTYATDCTNWDSLMKGPLWDVAMTIFSEVQRRNPSLDNDLFWWVLRHQTMTMRGRTANGVLWGIPGTMKSASYDTCLANSLVNLILHIVCGGRGGLQPHGGPTFGQWLLYHCLGR